MNHHSLKAFTLIELSIALVIIALIVGGVLLGKDLIEAAKMRSQARQLQEFEVAFNTFRLKYNCMPGDCKTATQFFSGTSNGDGNEVITTNRQYTNDWGANGFQNGGEGSRFFQHLSLAGLVAETYDGSTYLGTSYPRLKLYPDKGMGAAYNIGGWNSNPVTALTLDLTSASAATNTSASLFMNIVTVTTPLTVSYNSWNGIFTPRILQQLDSKIDDGIARTGKLKAYRAMDSQVWNCLTALDGDYLLANTNTACMAEYVLKQN